jgi:hypothetical protein
VTFPYMCVCIYIYVYECMYYKPDWFISSIFLLSTLVHLLWWFQWV